MLAYGYLYVMWFLESLGLGGGGYTYPVYTAGSKSLCMLSCLWYIK